MRKKEDLRILFMGTPEFAVECLRPLVEGGYNIVAVVTMPDKPAGRGHKLQFSALKEYALSVGLPILQPERLKEETFLQQLRELRIDLQIVVAFRMLPEVVWNMPPLGTFNLHASLLPQYRGAAPINWAMINGETETGVTTFFLKHEIDTGDVIFQEKTPISPNENVGQLHDRLMLMGGKLVKQTVDAILEDNVPQLPQEQLAEGELKPAPKIFKDTCQIKFEQSAEHIHNFIRGLSPYPGAWCELTLPGMDTATIVKVYAAHPEQKTNITLTPGNIETDGKTYMKVTTKDGYIHLDEVQLAGKKRMSVRDMLNGLKK